MIKGTAVAAVLVVAAGAAALGLMPDRVTAAVTGAIAGPAHLDLGGFAEAGTSVASVAPAKTSSGPAATNAGSSNGKDFNITGVLSKTPGNGSQIVGGGDAVLYPGAQVFLRVTVNNPNHFAIKVTSLTATPNKYATNPDGSVAAGCPTISNDGTPMNIMITSPVSLSLPIAGSGSAALDLPVTMPTSAADACQRVSFGITFQGQAVKS